MAGGHIVAGMDAGTLVWEYCYAAMVIVLVWALTCPPRDAPTGLLMMSYNVAALAAGVALALQSLAPHSVLIGPLWLTFAAAVCPVLLALRWWWAFGSDLDDDDNGGGEDGPGGDEPDGPGGDSVDWDAFDAARRDWSKPRDLALA
jgi:hypothetical protein